jgi:lipopolysaccharide transport system ATP-binding protein
VKPAIRIRGLAKRYTIGVRRAAYSTLRESISNVGRWGRRPGGGAAVGPTHWALGGVDIDVAEGEVVGLIGRNGAGKSTLLKILSRITEPTAGRVELFGRVASLLEVGTGFHPELTGRENIFLNGAVLGMRRRETLRRFDEIVEFAGVEKFLDTPVKHYSSGMYVRLAFAVAAHLEPEILLVDEVLAVGDAEFQGKCLNKMGDVARSGRTVVLVSHNMPAVHALCSRVVWLSDGVVAGDGPAGDVMSRYLSAGSELSGERRWDGPGAPGNHRVRLRAVRVVDAEENVTGSVGIAGDVHIEVDFWNVEPGLRNVCVNVYLQDDGGNTVLSTASTPGANALPEAWFAKAHPPGLYRSRCTIPGNFLNDRRYHVTVYVVTLGPLNVEAEAPHAVSFTVMDTGEMREAGGGATWDGMIRIRLPWVTSLVTGEADTDARAAGRPGAPFAAGPDATSGPAKE